MKRMGKTKVLAEVIRVLELEGQSILDCAQRLQQSKELGKSVDDVIDRKSVV